MASKHHGGARPGKAPSQRQLRIGEEIRHALADVFRRGDFRDPELQNLQVTVTEVRISPDLRNATAFVTPLGGEHVDEAVAALKRAAPFLRGQVARALNLRYAPMLGFEADTSFDYASKIATILHSPEVARDLGQRVNGGHDEDEADDVEYEDDDDEDQEGEEQDDDEAEYEDDGDEDDDADDSDDDTEYEDDEPPAKGN